MFKKLAMVGALTSAFIFGSAFDQPNKESIDRDRYQVSYSINGENGSLQEKDVRTVFQYFVNHLLEKYNIKLDLQDKQKEQKPDPKEETEKKEQTTPTKEPVQQEQPAVKEPSKEKAPEKEQVPEQVKEEKTEQVKEKDENKKEDSNLLPFEQEVVNITNEERQKHGLAPLQVDGELSKVAREKSQDMAANGYFSHNSPTYGSPFNMMKSFGITYRTAGENIAKGQQSPEEVVNAWMNSEGHRANILNPNFTHIGVGFVEQGNYWTQQFIGK